METPFFFPGELIAFTRTVPNLPFLYADDEWDKIKSEHFIHELDWVSNITPDFSEVLEYRSSNPSRSRILKRP